VELTLAGRTALVTGANGGLGSHFARTLAKAGAKVAVAARRLDSLKGADILKVAPESYKSDVKYPNSSIARKLKGMRWDRESAAIQREIDRLQELGAGQHGHEIDALWQRKIELRHLIEKLI
jgi:NAD(P)-dependent dehydrogenase (short-subunit alcohol dehydrogenase family)